jgi:AcrR family transcriptional regulator
VNEVGIEKKHTKDLIFDAAINLFSSKGYTETTIREISAAAGIKVGSLYNHYASKHDILTSIINLYATYTLDNVFKLWDVNNYKKLDMPVEDKIMCFLCLDFPKGEERKYLQALQMLFHEQFRNKTVQAFMRDCFIGRNEEYISFIINDLLAHDLIESVDPFFVARVHTAIIYKYSGSTMLGASGPVGEEGAYGMFEVLRTLYRTLIVEKKRQEPLNVCQDEKEGGFSVS